MSALLRPFLDRWRFVALVISGAMLATAHGFETFGGLAPCELCLKQRTVYWVAGAIAAAAMIVVRLPGGPRWREASCWLLALVFLASVGIAGYHAGVEWHFWPGPASCSGGGKVSMAALNDLLQGKGVKMPNCDEPAWKLFGLSMAGWNTVASVVFVALSVAAAIRERRKA
ncbi:MAG TPA: disulfide bond formation protein B [Phenylobacterium sp.]|jgi:disulfide bond formation protein DsbB|uniref:disulfide bond formation protein B n=1 Tax=Phenylobacterium sp. TaxID=1871053 RepID=UPI002D744C20|nr:disulfide bond formation protein B [Phenylobacterium sp.]HZZ67923.1 disulfide bond formation protein B [Phenylobacterium sp.]